MVYNRAMEQNQPDVIELNQIGVEATRPERADALENRARLLRVAETLFAERGVDAVNMTEIARTAGVGQGTLYRHFTSKGDLCMVLMDSQMRDFQEQVLAALRARTVAGEPYLAQLTWFIAYYIHFQLRHAPLLSSGSLTDVPKLPPGIGPASWLRMTIQGLLRAASNRGEIPADRDVQFVVAALLVLLRPDMLKTLHETHAQSAEAMSAGLQQMICALLTK